GIYCVAKFKTVANDYAFTPPTGITKLDYLVVGGGGGGASGGGGAGGFLAANDFTVAAATPIAIAVGGGGAGGTGGNFGGATTSSNGDNSSFGSIIATGGGGGGAQGYVTSLTGASGGGSRFDCTNSGCGNGRAGLGIAGQGNNGGYSTYNSYGAGGGGGGAGGAGFNTVRTYVGANGGIGLQSDITGTPTYYAGGGGGGINNNHNQYVAFDGINSVTFNGNTPTTTGGGQGGLGGGGRGSSFGFSGGTRGQYANATAGEANTGGGGTDPEDIGAGAGGSGVVIVRWVSNVNLKTVTFKSNLPTGSTTTTQTVAAGVAANLNINTFTRNGYVFMGWNTAADGTGTSYIDEGSITTSTDATLYAKWEAGVTHTVTFDANTGTGTMSTQTAGTSTTLNPNTFSKASATFDGWNTRADGTGFAYPEGAIYSFDSDITMFAQWRAVVATYRVTFYGNGADSGTTASQSASTSTALNLNGFVRAGYNFLGWNSTYNAGTAQYLDGQAYAFNADASLYAIWVAQASNNITFDKNDVNATGTTATQTASSSTQLSANGFTNSGYTFRGWNTAANGSGTSYRANYVYSFATGLTL
ncbi:MAG: InlB B-repeat-containing protein, partial [Micrococcales bacterium]